MPIIRRYLRLSSRDTILVRIFLNQDDITYFTSTLRQSATEHTGHDNELEIISSAPSRLHSIFKAIQPIVHRRLREQKREKGLSVVRVVGDRDGPDRQTTLENDTIASSNIPGVVIREGAAGNKTGDVVCNRREGWECSVFLVKDRSKQSAVLIKDMQLIPRRTRTSKKRQKEVIDVDGDGDPMTTAPVQDEQNDDDDDDDIKPEMRTSYTGFDIYGKTLYLVLRRVRVTAGNITRDTSLWGDVTDSDEGDKGDESDKDLLPPQLGSIGSERDDDASGETGGGIVGWISASQSIQPNEGVDFEAR
ncbi:hypothetical protein POJ06DRAFT_274716 [Lipomyces tetrasporus]|uniref:Uncharacterized protein n=1 Tax=Lipomyces tetrasporus TaxID=54092 RepID=A0AAD7VTG0_9ASCO|nr:uncharacterized protein POJ06DRAFT_274716 [Lipomyces tetrasporus]KAJ8100946.1 hypothetical protein POJ06DRAFT_274716 [Lipomyces tetrasporus]